MPRATDERYHSCALDKRTGEVLDFRCPSTLNGLVRQLNKAQDYFRDAELRLCCEASYVGFSLQRDLEFVDISASGCASH